MSDQRFCDYCGVDTRDDHRLECPAPELNELRYRIERLEAAAPPSEKDESAP